MSEDDTKAVIVALPPDENSSPEKLEETERSELPNGVALTGQRSVDEAHVLSGPEPTPEELESLRVVTDRLPVAAYFVLIVELAERFTYYGLSGVFQNYMQLARDNGKQNGALGLGQSTSTALSYFFQFWCYVTPVPAGLVADMYLGKYYTIMISTCIYIVGNLVLFVTSLPVSINGGHAEGGLIAAMIIIGIGTGGIKANVSTLVADQYTNKRKFVKTLKSGERVIVDPDQTIQYIFMIFYWAVNLGSLSAIATTELEQHVDFWAAYLLPFCFFFLALIVLVLGRKKYIVRPPQGSPIPNSIKIIGMTLRNAVSKRGHRLPPPEEEDLEHIEFNWFERLGRSVTTRIGKCFKNFQLGIAKPSIRAELGLSPVPWTDNFVDQVHRSLIACKVFLFYPIYWVCYGQMLNNFVSQAGTMQTHKIPNDIMQNIDPIALIIFVPIMGWWGYPLLRRLGFKLLPMARITLGLFLSSIAMAYAAIVQHLIYSSPPCYNAPLNCPAALDGTLPNQVHVAVQTPAYVLVAFTEIFASITGYEYAYTKAPPSMKAFMMAIYLLTNAVGSALGIAVSPTAKDPKLMWMYIGLCCAALVASGLFWIFYSQYDRIEESLNNLDIDEIEAEVAAREAAGENIDPLKNILQRRQHSDIHHNFEANSEEAASEDPAISNNKNS